MARKESTVTITTEGRDKGKVFVLTELSCAQSEEWATRALFAMMNAGVEIPDNLMSAGLAGIAALGLQSLTKINYDAAKPLLDEMFTCIQIRPSQNVTRELVESDIEEVATRLQLRKEILYLHIDFFTAAAPSTSGSVASPTVG